MEILSTKPKIRRKNDGDSGEEISHRKDKKSKIDGTNLGLPDASTNDNESISFLQDDEVNYWCYMITNYIHSVNVNTHVGFSQHPDLELKGHNNALIKATKNAAPNWVLEMIIGPFKNEKMAAEFCKNWSKNSRGIQSRRNTGKDLAKNAELTCYDKQVSKKTK